MVESIYKNWMFAIQTMGHDGFSTENIEQPDNKCYSTVEIPANICSNTANTN